MPPPLPRLACGAAFPKGVLALSAHMPLPELVSRLNRFRPAILTPCYPLRAPGNRGSASACCNRDGSPKSRKSASFADPSLTEQPFSSPYCRALLERCRIAPCTGGPWLRCLSTQAEGANELIQTFIVSSIQLDLTPPGRGNNLGKRGYWGLARRVECGRGLARGFLRSHVLSAIRRRSRQAARASCVCVRSGACSA